MIYLILTGILLFYALYMFINIIAGMFYSSPVYEHIDTDHSFLLFYPAYKPTEQVVDNLNIMKAEIADVNAKLYVLSQDATSEINEQIEDIADYFDAASFSSGEGNAYHKALQFAAGRISKISTGQQRIKSVMIMDPDNVTDQASIKRLLQGRVEGADVVLSRRKATNNSADESLFDGISERINDYMMRRSKQVFGLIPELSGSGMLMDRQLFEQAVMKLDRKAPGMDKQLLINMMSLKQDLKVLFDEGAVIYDEKTEEANAFNRQRMRWFGNQYYNARVFGWALIRSLNPSRMDYAIALCRPPRSVHIVFSMILAPFDLMMFLNGWVSAPLIALSAAALGLSLSAFFINEGIGGRVLRQIFSLSKISIQNGITAFKSLKPGNTGTFIHTRS